MNDQEKEIQVLNRKIEKLKKKLIQSEKQRDRNNNLFEKLTAEIESQRESIEEKNKELTLTQYGMDNAGDSVWWIEPSTAKILHANETAWTSLGYTQEEFINMSIPQIDPVFPPDKWPPLVEHLKAGNIQVFESKHKKSGGSIIPIEVCARYFEYGESGYIVAFSRDITERKKAEELLRAAKDEAEAATDAKSKFLATMSHEIRNPMNAIIGLTHLALGTNLDIKQKDYISKAHASSKNLLGIINDILDFSKIEAGKLDIETISFDLFKVMEDIRDVFIFKTEEKGIEFKICKDDKVPQYLMGDPLRIGQILTNFVSNAIKFTTEGSVTINANYLDGNIDRVKLKLSVKDTGLGMTPEQVAKMFKSYSQADKSTSRKFGGTGLGLSISKHLSELMKGEVGVESKQGKGSTFYFTAEFDICHDTAQFEYDESDLTATSFQGVKVLLAEDNEINQQVASEIMKSADIEVITADNGKIAYELVKGNEGGYHLLFMDLQMPEMDGVTATKKIRKLKQSNEIPIVAMSADVMDGVREECLNAGMNDFITKPIEPKEVFEMVGKWVGEDKRQMIKDKNDKEMKSEDRSNYKEVSKEIEIPEMETVNIEEGLQRVGGNKKLFVSLIEKFYKGNQDFKEQVNDALKKNDPELSERITHTLKGVTGNLGMTELHLASKELDDIMKVDITKVKAADVNKVDKLLKKVLKEIEKSFEFSKADDFVSKVKLEDVRDKLVELKAGLEDYDSETRMILEDMGIIEGHESDCEKLSEMIQNYDYDGALTVLENLMK